MSARWAPEIDPLRRPRWPSGQDHENQTILCSIWPVLQPRIKPRRSGFVWPEENCPRLCLVSPKVFYSISVTDGVLGPCLCRLWLAYLGTLDWLHRHYWKRAELDDVNTEPPMNWLELEKWLVNVLLHYWQTIFLFDSVKLLWHNQYCIKRYVNKGDLTWFYIL